MSDFGSIFYATQRRPRLAAFASRVAAHQHLAVHFLDTQARVAIFVSRAACHPRGAGTPSFESVRKRVKIHGRASGANTITRSVVRRPSAPRPIWGSWLPRQF